MVKIRKPKKDNKEVIPVENPEVIQEGLSKAEEFITKNKNLLYLATGIILVLFISFTAFKISLIEYFSSIMNQPYRVLSY